MPLPGRKRVLCGRDETIVFHGKVCGPLTRLRLARSSTPPKSLVGRVIEAVSPRTREGIQRFVGSACLGHPLADPDSMAHAIFALDDARAETRIVAGFPRATQQALCIPLAHRLEEVGLNPQTGSIVIRTPRHEDEEPLGPSTIIHLSRLIEKMMEKPGASPRQNARLSASFFGVSPTPRITALRLSQAYWYIRDLVELDVSHLRIPAFPAVVTKFMTRLVSLVAIACSLESLPADIGALAVLETLNVRDNCLTALPAALGACTRLRHLNVARNRLDLLPASIFKDLRALEELRASGNRLQSVPEDALAALPFLREIDVSINSLVESPERLVSSRSLRFVSLTGNRTPLSVSGELRRKCIVTH